MKPEPRRGLERRTGLPRTGQLRRTGRLPAMSKRRRDTAPTRYEIRQAVIERDGGCLLHPSQPLNTMGREWGPCAFGLTPHHLRKPHDGGEYTEENLVCLCVFHNDAVEDWPIQAESIGLVRR